MSDHCPAATLNHAGHVRPGQASCYLVRFDDICPTMNWALWDRIEPILTSLEIKRILAVLPDNQDPALVVCPPNKGFWQRVRRMAGPGMVHRLAWLPASLRQC